MRKSITKITSQLKTQLNEIHELVNQIEKKNTQSTKNIRNWLLTTEEVLKSLNLPESSKFAVKRATLSSFIPSSRNKKKEVLQLAASTLTEAQHDLWEIYTPYATALENSTKLIEQLLVVIYQTKQFKYDANQDFTKFLEQIWSFCCNHEQLKGISIQILSMVNQSDVFIIMGEKIAIESL
ncbi:hypothetical protein P8625_09430 [Tenacibaculum tangerinum]|uniref:Uncharacterized protein n=1 Tax=Tenacibaculum tangerinum TaxID=3038772 RepID=A0ABY8KYM4_9FLAO|nr:hypothetical protein [Tenacibaculum tangerinum]WGH74336.1 hypothetical protein P8625_09430 [Tenacibaculum tangerinum]